MTKQAKVYKALMVEDTTHYEVVVQAKKEKKTIDQFIKELLKK